MQTLIVCGLQMGISKRALFEDYYMDEVPILFEQYQKMHDPNRVQEEQVSAFDFLGVTSEEVSK